MNQFNDAVKEAVRRTEDSRWTLAYLAKAYTEEAQHLIMEVRNVAESSDVDTEALLSIVMDYVPKLGHP